MNINLQLNDVVLTIDLFLVLNLLEVILFYFYSKNGNPGKLKTMNHDTI